MNWNWHPDDPDAQISLILPEIWAGKSNCVVQKSQGQWRWWFHNSDLTCVADGICNTEKQAKTACQTAALEYFLGIRKKA